MLRNCGKILLHMKNKNIIISVIALLVIIIGIVWYNVANKPVVKNQLRIHNSVDGVLTTSATDTSDTALQSDLNLVNSQLNSLNTDTTNIDQTLPQ